MTPKVRFMKPETELFDTARVIRIATIDLNENSPHTVPICFASGNGSFYTTLSKRSKRARNVKRGSKVSILIDKYEERDGQWLTLQGLLIKCKVTLLSMHDDKDLFMKGWRMLIKKYPQYKNWANEDMTPKDPEKRLIMELQPTEKISWGFTS
jgi:nitroimidazol reductase NimA-like FMN-containing flavoprotein (pyridoxamine 5'-phosphate oxidase superfamily)